VNLTQPNRHSGMDQRRQCLNGVVGYSAVGAQAMSDSRFSETDRQDFARPFAHWYSVA
jgi:hypothetical protein